MAEVLAYTDTFRYVGLESARAIAEQLECHCIDLEEFSQLMTAAFEGCGDAAFRQEMLPMLTAFMLSKMPRKAKFRWGQEADEVVVGPGWELRRPSGWLSSACEGEALWLCAYFRVKPLRAGTCLRGWLRSARTGRAV